MKSTWFDLSCANDLLNHVFGSLLSLLRSLLALKFYSAGQVFVATIMSSVH